MDDAVAVALKIVARTARHIALFVVQPPPAVCRIAGIAL